MRPYVVEKIKTEEGADKNTEPQEKRRVLKKETSEEISRMLVNVVDKALLGGMYKIEHYTVAAKTGTAQAIKKAGEKGYNEEEYIHTFFGYAPGFDAKFLVFLYLVKPHGVKYASHSLTEPFMNITKFLLNYYQVPPDR
jgi:cell division protein FtsI/penicillin-binding protein 2